jgi:hypothetical protein
MKTGNIKINFEEGKIPFVEIRLINNSLWLTQNELARFFGVFVQKINAEVNAIFKNELLYEPDCTFCNCYIDKGLEKQVILYNLDVLTFLAYRIDSFEARIFRKFVKSALNEHLQKRKIPDTKIVWAYVPNNYCLN